MPYHALSTSKIARRVGCHPNTVMLYEKWGLIATVPRGANGYRLFEESHLDQMRLARTAMDGLYPGTYIRKKAYRVIRLVVAGELQSATIAANDYLAAVRRERKRAEKAIRVIDKWMLGKRTDNPVRTLSIGETSALLEISRDKLRNWERNGLIRVSRNPKNGYRSYRQSDTDRLRVIELLLHCGFGMMAIHRVMQHVDKGDFTDLHSTLDTPDQHEIVYPSDQWLTTLAEQEKRAKRVILILEEMISRQ